MRLFKWWMFYWLICQSVCWVSVTRWTQQCIVSLLLEYLMLRSRSGVVNSFSCSMGADVRHLLWKLMSTKVLDCFLKWIALILKKTWHVCTLFNKTNCAYKHSFLCNYGLIDFIEASFVCDLYIEHCIRTPVLQWVNELSHKTECHCTARELTLLKCGRQFQTFHFNRCKLAFEAHSLHVSDQVCTDTYILSFPDLDGDKSQKDVFTHKKA